MSDIEHPNDIIRTVLGSILIELNNRNMYDYLKDVVLPSPNSLYYKGDVDSLLPNDTILYRPDADNILTPIVDYQDILDNPTDIYKHDAELVMRGNVIREHKKHIDTQPTIPASFLKIMEIFILNKLNRMCKRSMLTGFHDIGRYLKDTDIDTDAVEDKIEEYYSTEISMLYEFIGRDVWNIYFKHTQNSLLVIEKSVDWRIYDWHCQNYVEEHC